MKKNHRVIEKIKAEFNGPCAAQRSAGVLSAAQGSSSFISTLRFSLTSSADSGSLAGLNPALKLFLWLHITLCPRCAQFDHGSVGAVLGLRCSWWSPRSACGLRGFSSKTLHVCKRMGITWRRTWRLHDLTKFSRNKSLD